MVHSPKNFTCLLGKLKAEFSRMMAKFTSPGLLDITFFVHYMYPHLLWDSLQVCFHPYELNTLDNNDLNQVSLQQF